MLEQDSAQSLVKVCTKTLEFGSLHRDFPVTCVRVNGYPRSTRNNI